MRLHLLGSLVSFVAAATCIACASPPAAGDNASKKPSKSHSASETDPTDTPDPGADPSGDGTGEQAPGSEGAPSAACTGTAIAAFADRLVNAARTSCTSNGAGVVTDTNYTCLKDPIFKLAPPFPDAAFARVEYWAKNGNNFAGKTTLFQCVEFAFAVTAAVCGKPINAGDAQIDVNMQIPGYTYMSRTQAKPEAGDVLVMDGHIAITAAVMGSNSIRVAEANCLTLSGSMTTGQDTGVISNTRTDTTTNSWIYGWYRKQ